VTEHEPDDAIRAWFREGPSRGPERGLDETLARVGAARQGAGREIRLPLWLPAAAILALLLAAVLAFGAGFRIVRPISDALPAPTTATSGPCRLETPVGGTHGFIIGSGFAPDTDVTIDITRGDGSQISLDTAYSAALHTDRRGAFGVEVRPYDADKGTETLVARAGCVATLVVQVTAADLPPPCPDPAVAAAPAVDGPAYRAAVATDRPLAWWHMDDTGSIAADAIGNHQATYVGGIEHAVRSALSDGGSTFFHHQFPDPTVAQLADPIVLDGDFTIEFWTLMCHYTDDGDPIVGALGSDISLKLGGSLLHVETPAGQVASVDHPVATLVWEHWALTRADGALQLYRHGQPDGWGQDADWHNPFPIGIIGGDGFGDNLLGYLDELAIYDRALPAARIAAHVSP